MTVLHPSVHHSNEFSHQFNRIMTIIIYYGSSPNCLGSLPINSFNSQHWTSSPVIVHWHGLSWPVVHSEDTLLSGRWQSTSRLYTVTYSPVPFGRSGWFHHPPSHCTHQTTLGHVCVFAGLSTIIIIVISPTSHPSGPTGEIYSATLSHTHVHSSPGQTT